ncbi:DMP19 family protein (plasmid) [Methylomonas sp. HW2-6]|uniref:DMP19 family protein n=1 Tax=Methylomonas sp. HW2-6 TaxID=3376687 RepID=UPI00404289CF
MSNLPIYERIPNSVQEALNHVSDNDFAIAMSNLVYAREATIGFDALTDPERVVFCLDKLEQEINNGGFEQYFHNLSGNIAAATPSALRAMGASQVASIVEKALELFPNSQPPTDQAQREKQMESWGPEQEDILENLDKAFLAYPEPLAKLERGYVQKYENFFLVPHGAGQSVRAI